MALKAAEAAYMPKGTVFAPFNPMVVNTGSKLVMIDTGYGPVSPTVGLLPQSLAAAGIDPKSIDIVLISHMHGDHINGIKNPDGSLAFPNAEIKVPAVDWEFWMDDANAAKAPEGFFKASFGFCRKIFGDMKTRVTIYQPGSEVAPGSGVDDCAGQARAQCHRSTQPGLELSARLGHRHAHDLGHGDGGVGLHDQGLGGHQLVDGADAGRFITTIKDRLQTADFQADLEV